MTSFNPLTTPIATPITNPDGTINLVWNEFFIRYMAMIASGIDNVIVSGVTVFKYLTGQSVPVNTTIVLTANLYGSLTLYDWEYWDGSDWADLSGTQNANSYSLAYNNAAWGTDTSLLVRCLSGTISDQITIVKVYDGTDGDDGLDAGNWSSILTLTATDYRTVTWGSGTLYSGINVYNISSGTTGAMAPLTPYYIYFNPSVSDTTLAVTTTASAAVGAGQILVGVAFPNADTGIDAQFQVFGGQGGVFIAADNIAAGSITGDKIVANSLTATQINTSAISIGSWADAGELAEMDEADIAQSLPSDENLVAYWSFDDGTGTTVTDLSSNSNDGTITGTTTWVPGVSGSGLDFASAGGIVNCGTDSSLQDTGDRTLSLWYKPENTLDDGYHKYLYSNESYLNYGQLWIIYVTTGLQYYRHNTSGAATQALSNTSLTANVWNHICVVVESEVVTFYLNGVADGGGTVTAEAASTTNAIIGLNSLHGPNGIMDEFRVYDTALTAAEIKALYRFPGGSTSFSVALQAQVSADDAQADATDAVEELMDISEDSKITPVEKLTVKPLWDAIETEGQPTTGTIIVQAAYYSVSSTTYASSYLALSTLLNTTYSVFDDMEATTDIVRTTWDHRWYMYYVEKTKILNSIADATAALAVWADITGTGKPSPNADVTQTVLDAGADIDSAKVNDDTFIVGGFIDTAIVATKSLYAGAVTAAKIDTDAVTATKMHSDALSTCKFYCTDDNTEAESTFLNKTTTSDSTVAVTGWNAYNGSGYAHGVYGYSSSTNTGSRGVWGICNYGYGVQGQTQWGYGVYGYAATSSGIGVYGNNNSSGGYGVYGSAGSIGVYGNTTATTQYYGLATDDYCYAAAGYKPFTGSHIGFSKQKIAAGDIVCSEGALLLSISESLPFLGVSAKANDKAAIGVVVQVADTTNVLESEALQLLVKDNRFFDKVPINERTIVAGSNEPKRGTKIGDKTVVNDGYEYVAKADTGIGKKGERPTTFLGVINSQEYYVTDINALGEGGVNVCSEGGNIEIGDYICTSSTPGKGMRQADDILHNYTVAKALEDVTWSGEGNMIKTIACTYHCG